MSSAAVRVAASMPSESSEPASLIGPRAGFTMYWRCIRARPAASRNMVVRGEKESFRWGSRGDVGQLAAARRASAIEVDGSATSMRSGRSRALGAKAAPSRSSAMESKKNHPRNLCYASPLYPEIQR